MEPRAAKMPPRQIVPMAVMRRAQNATEKVVNQAVRGDNQAVIDAWHPGFVKSIARPFGGEKRFKAQMLKMMNQMGANGIAIQAAITQQPQTAFEVDYGFQDVLVDGKPVPGDDGKPVQEAGYRAWMVYVPTVMDVFMRDQDAKPPVLKKIRSHSFQIAISPKRNENWTFIDGGSVTPMQLREIFPFLPKNKKQLNFPKVKKEEIKE